MWNGQKILLAIFALAVVFIIWDYATERYSEQHVTIITRHDGKNCEESDYQRLIDLKDFSFTIQHQSCRRKSEVRPRVLIVVHSKAQNYARRQTIRDTWGYEDPFSVIFFAVGAVINDEKMQSLIEAENDWHQDIIQGNFLDTYRNLTYKAMMCLKFAVYHCQDAEYILKMDDDAFVNTPFLYHSIQNGPFFNPDHLILCQKMDGSPAIREQSKWKVTKEEFAGDFYPMYCSGFSIIYSADVVSLLYRQGQTTKYLFIDDAFVSGIVRKQTGIPLTDNLNWFMDRPKMDQYVEGKSNATQSFLFTAPNLTEDQIRKLWQVVKNWKYAL
jgi:hypothetical protein